MPASLFRTLLPLALVTGTSMLAMDLYLPAVPTLQAALGVPVTLAQATVAVFLAGLAASQLVWGVALNRLGPRRCVLLGGGALVLTSAGCALAPDIGWLLALRALQGAAAGAATVVTPSVVRASFGDHDAVRGLATIAMIESSVPAAGPVLGAVLLGVTDWRGTFWVLAAVAAAALPFAVRVSPRELPGLDRTVPAGYAVLLRNGRFLRLAGSQALAMGALLTFVASAPQLTRHVYGLGAAGFATLQVASVAVFMVVASQSGRISKALGPHRAIQLGAALHLALCALLCVAAATATVPFAALLAFWCAFCGALAVRGPASFSEALSLPPSQMGRASALMVLAILVAGAVGTQGVAPFLAGATVVPVAAAMALQCALALLLVMRYPHNRPG